MTYQKSETKTGLVPTSQFTRDGYALLQGSVPQQAVLDLYQTVVLLIQRYDESLSGTEFERLMSAPPWTDSGFNGRLIALRADQAKMFGMVYDVVQLSTAMHRLCVEPQLLAAVGHAWGVDPKALAVTGHMLRMDPPHDTRNSLDWHQDSSYYEQNLAGENGMVVWIPMHHVDEKNGSLLVCPGSHHEGQVEAVLSDPSDASMSRQRRVPQGSTSDMVISRLFWLVLTDSIGFFHRKTDGGRRICSEWVFSTRRGGGAGASPGGRLNRNSTVENPHLFRLSFGFHQTHSGKSDSCHFWQIIGLFNHFIENPNIPIFPTDLPEYSSFSSTNLA